MENEKSVISLILFVLIFKIISKYNKIIIKA